MGAMKQRAVERLSTLRMVKSALKNKEIDQRAPVTDAQAVQVLTTLIKQRKDSIEQFTKGNRPELAEKEAAEIMVIEEYMPKAAGDEELRQLVTSTLAELRAQGAQLGPKDMGTVMKAVQAQDSGQRPAGRRPGGQRNGEGGAGRLRVYPATTRRVMTPAFSCSWRCRGTLTVARTDEFMPPSLGDHFDEDAVRQFATRGRARLRL